MLTPDRTLERNRGARSSEKLYTPNRRILYEQNESDLAHSQSVLESIDKRHAGRDENPFGSASRYSRVSQPAPYNQRLSQYDQFNNEKKATRLADDVAELKSRIHLGLQRFMNDVLKDSQVPKKENFEYHDLQTDKMLEAEVTHLQVLHATLQDANSQYADLKVRAKKHEEHGEDVENYKKCISEISRYYNSEHSNPDQELANKESCFKDLEDIAK